MFGRQGCGLQSSPPRPGRPSLFLAEVRSGPRRAPCSRGGMAESVICTRSFQFGCRLLKVCAQVWERGPAGRHVAQQLMRSGTSIGANAEEAQEAQTKPDFIARLSVSRKEARETQYCSGWLFRQELPRRRNLD